MIQEVVTATNVTILVQLVLRMVREVVKLVVLAQSITTDIVPALTALGILAEIVYSVIQLVLHVTELVHINAIHVMATLL